MTTCRRQSLAQLTCPPGPPRRQRDLLAVDDDGEPSERGDARGDPTSTLARTGPSFRRAWASTGDELLDKSQPVVDISTDVREVVIAGKLDQPRSGHAFDRLSGSIDRHDAIPNPVTSQGRHINVTQHRSHIYLVIHCDQVTQTRPGSPTGARSEAATSGTRDRTPSTAP